MRRALFLPTTAAACLFLAACAPVDDQPDAATSPIPIVASANELADDWTNALGQLALPLVQGGFGARIQAIGPNRTHLVARFVLGGRVSDAVRHEVDAGASVRVEPPAGFETGAALVVTADGPLAGVSDLRISTSQAAYTAARSHAARLPVPLLMAHNSGYSSTLHVQNLDRATQRVTVRYTDGTTAEVAIPPFATHALAQQSETHGARVFGATVESAAALTAAVTMTDGRVLAAYTAGQAANPAPVFPLINANNSGYVTGVQVMNVGRQDTDITIDYTPTAAGVACRETQRVGAGSTATFALAAFANGANSNCRARERFVGSARVTANGANQPLLALANQLNPGVNMETYLGFDARRAASEVFLPLAIGRADGYWTGINVMRMSGPATYVDCTFAGSGVTVSRYVDSATTFNLLDLGDGYVGAGRCRARDPQTRIGAVVNVLGAGTDDRLSVYEALVAGTEASPVMLVDVSQANWDAARGDSRFTTVTAVGMQALALQYAGGATLRAAATGEVLFGSAGALTASELTGATVLGAVSTATLVGAIGVGLALVVAAGWDGIGDMPPVQAGSVAVFANGRWVTVPASNAPPYLPPSDVTYGQAVATTTALTGQLTSLGMMQIRVVESGAQVQTCPNATLNLLNGIKNARCNVARSCRSLTSCADLQDYIRRNTECISARINVGATCYGGTLDVPNGTDMANPCPGVGSAGHYCQLLDVMAVLAECRNVGCFSGSTACAFCGAVPVAVPTPDPSECANSDCYVTTANEPTNAPQSRCVMGGTLLDSRRFTWTCAPSGGRRRWSVGTPMP